MPIEDARLLLHTAARQQGDGRDCVPRQRVNQRSGRRASLGLAVWGWIRNHDHGPPVNQCSVLGRQTRCTKRLQVLAAMSASTQLGQHAGDQGTGMLACGRRASGPPWQGAPCLPAMQTNELCDVCTTSGVRMVLACGAGIVCATHKLHTHAHAHLRAHLPDAHAHTRLRLRE